MLYNFSVDLLDIGKWVISATGLDEEPAYLIGVYSSEEAALLALPGISVGWMRLKRAERERLNQQLGHLESTMAADDGARLFRFPSLPLN